MRLYPCSCKKKKKKRKYVCFPSSWEHGWNWLAVWTWIMAVSCGALCCYLSLKSVLLLLFKAFTGELICLKTFHKEKRKKILYFCCFSKYFWSTFHLTRVAVPDSNGLITAPCVLKQLVYWFLLEMAVEITCWISLY